MSTSNRGKSAHWIPVAVVLILLAAIALLIQRRAHLSTGGEAAVAEVSPREKPLHRMSLEELEQALIAAGELEDPEAREVRTLEIREALLEYHVRPELEAREKAAAELAAQESAAAGADAEQPAERSYDLDALRQEFDEALRTEDGHLRRLAIGAVAEFLAVHDPDVAALWMRELLESNHAGSDSDAYYFASVFTQTYARGDLVAAAEWADILPAQSLRHMAYQHIAREWASRDLSGVEAWIVSIEDDRLRSSAIRAVGNALVTTQDDEASAWAQRLAGDERDGVRHSDVVVQHWARTDVAAAIEWTNGLPHGDDVDRAIDGLASAFAAKDPREAAPWAESFPEGTARDKAITITANHWAKDDPQAAAAWLEGLHQQSLLEASFTVLASRWYDKDPVTAVQWMDTAGVSDELRTYVKNMIVK